MIDLATPAPRGAPLRCSQLRWVAEGTPRVSIRMQPEARPEGLSGADRPHSAAKWPSSTRLT